MVAHANNSTDQRHDLALWLGVLAGPVAWFVHLNLAYAWGWWACGGRSLLPSHLTGLLCLAVAASGGALAWREWRAVRGWPSEHDAGPVGHTRLMSALGLLTAALFGWVIVAQWVAVMLLDPCPRAG